MTDALTFDALWQQLIEAEDHYVAARECEERVERRYGAGGKDKRVMRAAIVADAAALRCIELRRTICAKPITCASDLRFVAQLAFDSPDDVDVTRALSSAVLAFAG